LMGVKNLPRIVAELLAGGISGETPVAVIRQGTTREQETVIGTLENIVERAARFHSPAVIVVGDVVQLNEQLQWFEPEISLGFRQGRPVEEAARDVALHS